MRFARFILLSCFLSFVVPAWGQQAAVSSTEATALLQKSLSALAPAGLVSDVTLSGNVRRVAGSDDESGTGDFEAIASSVGRIDLNLSDGQRSKVADLAGTVPSGSWTGPDGTPHALAYHNLLTDAAWFFPAFVIARRLSTPGFVATYVGQEVHDGQTVEHVSVYQQPPSGSGIDATTFAHLTRVDFYLDATTLLPLATTFNVHPDDNMLLDIPVEVRFGDYRTASGMVVPYHVQKYINNTLFLDFQAQTVAVNSGLTASSLDAP